MNIIKNNWKQIVFIVVALIELSRFFSFTDIVQYLAAMAAFLGVTYAAQHWDAF